MGVITNKLYQAIAIGLIITALLYFYVIKPKYDLEDAKRTISNNTSLVESIKAVNKVDVFEAKYEDNKTRKVDYEKMDIPMSIGYHTILFE